MSLYGQTEYQKTKNYKIWDPDISAKTCKYLLWNQAMGEQLLWFELYNSLHRYLIAGQNTFQFTGLWLYAVQESLCYLRDWSLIK